MANLDQLKFYKSDGAKFYIDTQSPGGRVLNFLGVVLVSLYVFGLAKYSTDGMKYVFGTLAVVSTIYSLGAIFSKTEFDLSTKLVTTHRFFGLRKNIKPFSQFTGFTYSSVKFLWFINAGCKVMLHFKDAQGKESFIYLRTLKTADVEQLFIETNSLFETDKATF